MDIEKIYINNDNMATIRCKKCEKIKIVNVSNFMEMKNSIKLKCKCNCGNVYSVFLERRKNYRKETNISGIYFKETNLAGEYIDNANEKGRVIILDLSNTGLRFKLHVQRNFKIGDKINIEFRLDDKHRTFIKKDVIIRRIHGLELGAEYCSKSAIDPMDKAIGWYLFK